MSDTPVTLNTIRKARKRDAARKAADQNAVRFGRTKAEKSADLAKELQRQKLLDQHQREDP